MVLLSNIDERVYVIGKYLERRIRKIYLFNDNYSNAYKCNENNKVLITT